jgi:hypothetical protein
MKIVTVGSLAEGDTFIYPWRPYGQRAGRVERVGLGSVSVHVARHEGDGWERTAIAHSTQVSPCPAEEYHEQSFGEGSSRVANRSQVRKPTEVVWAICDEMFADVDTLTTAMRDEMVKRAIADGVNESTAKTQYYRWKKNR